MNEIIATRNLKKHFGEVKAVDGINLSIGKGEIYGFLGLNGAGKTTTIRMLLGMINPASGECWLNGVKVSPGNQELWNRIGYLVEIPYSYPDLTVRENLEIVRRLRFLSDPHSVDAVMQKLRLEVYRDRLAKNLSLGNSQRLGIAKAIIHNPDILILDEPANGLDPAGIVEIREMLCDLALNKGVTVFISSHILGEISRFATRIGIIHEGVMKQELDTHQLEGYRQRKLLIKTKDIAGAQSLLESNGYTARSVNWEFLETTDARALNSPENLNLLLVSAGHPPSMLKVEEEDLETYFLRTIGINGGEK
jgi:ABC-2 type transport system ATP-binding protein